MARRSKSRSSKTSSAPTSTPLEEARGYTQLMEEFSYTQQQLADSVGQKPQPYRQYAEAAHASRQCEEVYRGGALTAGHARALVATGEPSALADQIVKLGLSVRQAEELSRGHAPAQRKFAKAPKDADTVALERQLADALGLKVEVTSKGRAGAA